MSVSFRCQIFVAAALFLYSGRPVFGKVERYLFRVDEKGTIVDEEIDVDVEKQTEVIRVPKHNDVDASDVLNDFASGLSVRRVPSTKDCYVSKLDNSMPTPQQMKLYLEQASQQTLLSEERIEKSITRVLGFANRLALPQKILGFCGSFPIYEIEEIRLETQKNTSFHKTQWPDQTVRKKRTHEQLQYHMCSKAESDKLNNCLAQRGFNFRQKCTFKTAHCYYIVDCHHVGPVNSKKRKYICNEIVHRVDYTDVCCEVFC